MKPVDSLTMLFVHHRWANLRLLECCAQLTDEQLDASIPGTFGTIRDTLEHIVTAEQSYLSRISTGKPYDRSGDTMPMTLADMMASARKTGTGLIEWVPQIGADESVVIDWDGTPQDVPKTIIITQVLYHATEHRAQIMAIMTQLGVQPPDLQSWAYFDENLT